MTVGAQAGVRERGEWWGAWRAGEGGQGPRRQDTRAQRQGAGPCGRENQSTELAERRDPQSGRNLKRQTGGLASWTVEIRACCLQMAAREHRDHLVRLASRMPPASRQVYLSVTAMAGRTTVGRPGLCKYALGRGSRRCWMMRGRHGPMGHGATRSVSASTWRARDAPRIQDRGQKSA